jgi:hypothetical protein
MVEAYNANTFIGVVRDYSNNAIFYFMKREKGVEQMAK